MATTLIVVDATTAARTEARALTCQNLRPSTEHILNATFPPRYRPPTNIPKYSGEMNPRLWLEDYRLACQAGGADNDDFIIRNLPLFLADST